MQQLLGSPTGQPWTCNFIIFMPLMSQLVDVRGSLPSFWNLLGIALLLSSAGPGTGVVALLLLARAASHIRVLLVELITELVFVLAAQKKRSTQTQSTVPLRHFSIGGLAASPAVVDFFFRLCSSCVYCCLCILLALPSSAVLFISFFFRALSLFHFLLNN